MGVSNKSKSILPPTWDVPKEFRNRLGDKPGRQRAMLADGHLLLVLHRPPKPDEVERAGRFFWRKPDGTWTSNDLGTSPRALAAHLTEYADLVETYDRQEEEAAAAAEYFAVIDALGPLLRAARNMHQALQEARKMCPQDRDIINYRDRAYEIERTAELLYNDAKNTLEFTMVKRAEDQAAASHKMAVAAHRLNILAAFFFPIAALSAIFGVNLKHGLENAPPPLAFLAVLAAGLVSGGVLTAFITSSRPGASQ
jgi:hypothetical protein